MMAVEVISRWFNLVNSHCLLTDCLQSNQLIYLSE
jgi:hypothetical protein